MALVTTNLGELELLDKMLKDALSSDEDLVLKLFQNDETPNSSSTTVSFTEATFTGYEVKTLTRAGWNSAVTVGGKAESSYGASPLSWTCGATGNTIYGYWVENSNETVLWAEKFSVARGLTDGDVLNLTPKFTLDSES